MFNLKNRRYLGCKNKLLTFIDEVISKNCDDVQSFADVFGGTGCVAAYFNDKYNILINDILESNYLAYRAFFDNSAVDLEKIHRLISFYNELEPHKIQKNYFSLNFADTYLSEANLRIVGFIRDDIDLISRNGKISERERAILITSLIYGVDRIANTVGHYDAYRRNGPLSAQLILSLPELPDQTENVQNVISKLDANSFVRRYRADLVYLDPPYNSRQYCDAYHFLENIAFNHKPPVFGVAKKMDRSALKSEYCTNKAPLFFADLIEQTKAKYILVSYNNTGDKINSRSNAKISDKEILSFLKRKGKVSVFEQPFLPFTTGKTQVVDHSERLFLCEVGNLKSKVACFLPTDHPKNSTIRSPLNYTGGKAKLYPQLAGFFPKKIKSFYDIFCGGATVGANSLASSITCVDNNQQLISLLNYIKQTPFAAIVTTLEKEIKNLGLSESSLHGYEYYGCNSSEGLGRVNKDRYEKLKERYNHEKTDHLFLLLLIFGFNNQIRFNRHGEFNLPVGKRDFNLMVRKKLLAFCSALQEKNISFICEDFKKLSVKRLKEEEAFLYLDPPYLLGAAPYNERKAWTSRDELELYSFLDECHNKKIKFALSNALVLKGLRHPFLEDWIKSRGYTMVQLSHSYSNSSYHRKDKTGETQEVLVINYESFDSTIV